MQARGTVLNANDQLDAVLVNDDGGNFGDRLSLLDSERLLRWTPFSTWVAALAHLPIHPLNRKTTRAAAYRPAFFSQLFSLRK